MSAVGSGLWKPGVGRQLKIVEAKVPSKGDWNVTLTWYIIEDFIRHGITGLTVHVSVQYLDARQGKVFYPWEISAAISQGIGY